jgi:hypothetical protein
MDKQYNIDISFIPIFEDNSVSQLDIDYKKILLDDEYNILKKRMTLFHSGPKQCLLELFTEYIKVHYEWPTKELVSCRKKEDTIEIIYTSKMLYFKDCIKNGKIVNTTNFYKLIPDNFYVECINGDPRRFD